MLHFESKVKDSFEKLGFITITLGIVLGVILAIIFGKTVDVGYYGARYERNWGADSSYLFRSCWGECSFWIIDDSNI